MLYITVSESGFIFGVSKPAFNFRFVDKFVKRFKMNEVIRVVEDHIGNFFDDVSKYPDKEYGKLRDFIERFYDVESDIDNEDDAVKKLFLQTKLEKMENCIKTFRG